MDPTPAAWLHDGADVDWNGLTYRINLMSRDEIDWRPPFDAPQFSRALQLLYQVSQYVDEINDRLLDPLDGMTNRAMHELLSSPQLDPAFSCKLAPYAFGLLKHGTNVLTERASVIVPPLDRSAFESQLARLPADVQRRLAWPHVLDHLFEPVPLITQGFYLFETPEDRSNFERGLGPSYAKLCQELRALFARALADTISPELGWELDRLSQQIMDAQKARLEAALQDAPPACQSMDTRVWISCSSDGTFSFRSVPFLREFASELSIIARLVQAAHDQLPASASELRAVLNALCHWCVEPNPSESWGESLPAWLQAQDPNNLLDVNLTFEEKVSRLGSKGSPQMLVCAFDGIPESLRSIYQQVQDRGRARQNMNILFLRQLIVGGGASNYTIAGEKLPDPAARPLYKVMTFTNTTRSALVMSNRQLILRATECTEAQIESLAETAKIMVLFHEYGHTLGDYSDFLGDLAGSVEETNAEASALYQCGRLAPEHLQSALLLDACWAPVRRALQGPTEPHSHANIVLFDEFCSAKGLEVHGDDHGYRVRVLSPKRVLDTAFAIALRMRLWEKGLPTEEHAALVEPLDSNDGGQDERVAQRAQSRLARVSDEQRTLMRRRVVEQCRAYFATDRLTAISQSLRPVLDCLPRFQPITVVPSDRRLRVLLGDSGLHPLESVARAADLSFA